MPYSSRLLTELVTETLSSVVFVAEYVQLDFNGPAAQERWQALGGPGESSVLRRDWLEGGR